MALLGAKHCLSLEMREDQTAKKKKKNPCSSGAHIFCEVDPCKQASGVAVISISLVCIQGTYSFRRGRSDVATQQGEVAEPGSPVRRAENVFGVLTYVNTARHCFKCFILHV